MTATDFSRFRYLIIDQHVAERLIVKKALRALGARMFHEAENGQEALEEMKVLPPDVCVVAE